MQRRKPLRAKSPDLEVRFWRRLRELNGRGAHFRKNVPYRTFTLPYAEHEALLVIELEDRAPGTKASPSRNIVRDQLLREEGYTILRLWKQDVAANLGGTIAAILEILDARRAASPDRAAEPGDCETASPRLLPPGAPRDED